MKIVVVLSLLVAVSGYDSKEFRKYFDAIDKNHDGKITLLEWIIHYRKYDVDADGIVSLKEFATSLLPETLPAVVKATYSFYDKMDGVSDGVLRYSLMDTAFTYHDVNHDGIICFNEYEFTCKKVIPLAPLRKVI
ncbi:uncharacterized protein LOC112569369 [Pomacea canaliculata]|uniref:uncharacterized protein LOC112569369 n=1 Tax=Pomacea canaliculata TaxID=400727 RepID=UPI000D735DA8|nr:uncharacterized protein LOC112569369 [Pomacea canaliculata]XP_025102952.1 uncharacterized protein LOC112569369 [Pomacea canaliculata]